MTNAELAQALDELTNILDDMMDPALTRVDLILKVKEMLAITDELGDEDYKRHLSQKGRPGPLRHHEYESEIARLRELLRMALDSLKLHWTNSGVTRDEWPGIWHKIEAELEFGESGSEKSETQK